MNEESTWRPEFLDGDLLFGKIIQLQVGESRYAGLYLNAPYLDGSFDYSVFAVQKGLERGRADGNVSGWHKTFYHRIKCWI